jgi:hypothetical protein
MAARKENEMSSQAIDVDIDAVLDMIEKEIPGYKKRWLYLRDLLAKQKAAQQSEQGTAVETEHTGNPYTCNHPDCRRLAESPLP